MSLLMLLPLVVEKGPEPEDVKAGWIAFVVFIGLILAVVVLGFSLVKQLRKAQAAKDAGLRRAVVSSSANTEQVLAVTGLADLVELRVDGLTARARSLPGKPAPDTFLAAAADLVEPDAEELQRQA